MTRQRPLSGMGGHPYDSAQLLASVQVHCRNATVHTKVSILVRLCDTMTQ